MINWNKVEKKYFFVKQLLMRAKQWTNVLSG